LRCLKSDLAREVIADHRAAVQAARDRIAAREAELAARPNPLQQRVRALQAAQAHLDGDPNVPAIVQLLANDPESKFNRSGRNLDEMMSGD